MTPHQDGTFLFNDPLKLVGLWFAIDNATKENGCLWYVPGSHKLEIRRRFVRNPNPESENLLIFEGQEHQVSLIILNSTLFHK